MLPTVLELLDIEPPLEIRGVTQSPIQGVSLAHTFDDARAESKRKTQYFEMAGEEVLVGKPDIDYPAPSPTKEGARQNLARISNEGGNGNRSVSR